MAEHPQKASDTHGVRGTGEPYFDSFLEAKTYKILPGGWFATSRDVPLMTVLGSCVAACLWDPVSGVGGMNHYMLIGEGDDGPQHADNPLDGRFAADAMQMLVADIISLGGRKERLSAKVFGGGHVLQGKVISQVSDDNVHFILDYLHRQDIPLLAHDLSSHYARKIYFFPRTGRVLMRRITDRYAIGLRGVK